MLAKDTTPQDKQLCKDSTSQDKQLCKDTTSHDIQLCKDTTSQDEQLCKDTTPQDKQLCYYTVSLNASDGRVTHSSLSTCITMESRHRLCFHFQPVQYIVLRVNRLGESYDGMTQTMATCRSESR